MAKPRMYKARCPRTIARGEKVLFGTLFVFLSCGVLPGGVLLGQETKRDSEAKSKKSDSKSGEKSATAPLPAGAIRRLGSVPDKYGAAPASGHTGGVYVLAFAPDGKRLASRGNDEKERVRIWDVASGKELHKLEGDGLLAWSGDGGTLITGNPEDGLILWDAAAAKPRMTLVARNIKTFTVLPDGKSAVMVHGLGSTEFVDLAAGKLTRSVPTRFATPLAFSPDGKMLAFTRSLYDPLIHLANADTGAELSVMFQGKRERVSVAAFSGDSRLLAAGGWDNLVHVWEVAAPQRLVCTLKGHTQRAHALAFSPDGRFLVTGGLDQTARLWDLVTGSQIAELRGHGGNVTAVAISPDGNLLATGSGDTTILLWDFWAAALETPSTPAALNEEQLQALWNDLEDGVEARRALSAVGLLAAAPQQALPLVQRKLQTYVEESQLERIGELIKQLDDDRYLVREQATEALIRLRKQADPLLRKALKEAQSEEARFRLRLVLGHSTSGPNIPPADTRRYLRVVLLLERIGTPEARKQLQHLSEAVPAPDVNREARAALARLERRTAAAK
jgi:hypothetical protein